MTYDTFDVVVVPFPFTDRSSTKRRPALVVSRHESFSAILSTIASPLRGDFAFYTPTAYSYTDVHIHRIVRIRTDLFPVPGRR